MAGEGNEQSEKQPIPHTEALPEVQDSAPTPEGQRAEETNGDLKDASNAAVGDMLDKVKEQVASSANFFDIEGKFDLEKAREVAASIPVEVLNEIESKSPGALIDLFTEQIDEKNFEVNFRGNGAAESLIGLSWILKSKPGVRVVEVTYPPDKGGHSRTGHRQGLQGSFYDNQGYVEVHSRYKVSIVREFAEGSPALERMQKQAADTVAEFEKSKDSPRFTQFMAMLDNDKYKRISDDPQVIAKMIVETSANYGVDPYLVMSLLKLEDGNSGQFFGIAEEGAVGFGIQLELMLRDIREHEVSYKALSGDRALRGGKYSAAFLAYFSKLYSPGAAAADRFDPLHRSYFQYRGESIPSNIKDEIATGRKLADQYMGGVSSRHEAKHPVDREQINQIMRGGMSVNDIVPSNYRGAGSGFGMRFHPIDHVYRVHQGVDIAAPIGSPVNSWRGGEVIFAGLSGGYGNLVKVKHPDGSESRYAHLSSINVSKGQHVEKNQNLGAIGTTGHSTGPHLHFEIRIDGQAIDPMSTS